jgi:segregation and condensation protein B
MDDKESKPFKTSIPEEPAANPADFLPGMFEDDPDATQLDALYQQALGAMEAVESGVQQIVEEEGHSEELSETETVSEPDSTDSTAVVLTDEEEAESSDINALDRSTRLSPIRVIEAALFVGGMQLTTKKLRTLLRGELRDGFIEEAIDQLNSQYAAEARPYEIVFGEGGYRMSLKSDFHRVRNRVFGMGPKEIRLSQDALEVLSLVAYRQPITPKNIDQLRRGNAGGTLRQLLRRELISLERDPKNRKHVEYQTTPRFLELFGLKHIDELPQADELNFK